MKKHVFLFGILAGLANAESLSYSGMNESLKSGLLTSYSFDKGGTADYQDSDFKLYMWDGSPVTGDFTTKDGHAVLGDSSNRIYNMDLGKAFSGTSFTVSFDLLSVTTGSGWKAIVALYSHGATDDGYKYCMNIRGGEKESDSIVLSTKDSDPKIEGFDGSTTAKSINTGIAGNVGELGKTLTLVSDGAESLLTLYIDGKQVGQISEWKSQQVTGIQFGGIAGNSYNVSSATLDNLHIWDRALTESEVKSLQVQAPEPATATLSLLALAGLAARRRRQA
ncbi:MAG: LamG-like jellyroll fold domain-containing protein [Akkermansia sp.]